MAFLKLGLLLLVSVSVSAQVSRDYKNKLADDMKLVAGIFTNQYGPRLWKEKHLGWNVQNELNIALTKVDMIENVQQYREALGDFVKSTQDYHVAVRFYSTERATLPFALLGEGAVGVGRRGRLSDRI